MLRWDEEQREVLQSVSPRKGEKLDMVSHIQESKHLKKTLTSQEATGATRSWDIPGLFLLLLFSFLFLPVDFFFLSVRFSWPSLPLSGAPSFQNCNQINWCDLSYPTQEILVAAIENQYESGTRKQALLNCTDGAGLDTVPFRGWVIRK